MSFQAANGTLVEIDDPVVAQDNDATLRIGREPEPTLQPENEEVPELEQPDRTIPIPEDGQELRKMIKDILGKQENEDVEEEQKTGDDADDDWDE